MRIGDRRRARQRPRVFPADKFGLHPVEEREWGLRYVCAEGQFALFESAGAASGDHTQMGWEVDDIEATVTERGAWSANSEGNMLGIGQPLRSRGG